MISIIEQIEKNQNSLIKIISKRLMNEHIIPLCNRFKLQYITGNGSNAWIDKKGRYVFHEDLPGAKLCKEIVKINKLTDNIEKELRFPILGYDYLSN